MGKPYSISGDPYKGEVMSVHEEDDGTYYVEIAELEWNQTGLATPQAAADTGLRRIQYRQIVIASGGDNTAMRIGVCRREIRDYDRKINELQEEIRTLQSEPLKPLFEPLSEGLRELPEDRPRVMRAMKMFFGEDSVYPAEAVAFKLYKDVDGDGDMDHAFVAWSRRKKLVNRDK